MAGSTALLYILLQQWKSIKVHGGRDVITDALHGPFCSECKRVEVCLQISFKYHSLDFTFIHTAWHL